VALKTDKIESAGKTQASITTKLQAADVLAKLLIEKGLITQEEFMEKLSAERATYQKLLNPTPQ
jgi:ribosomal protein L14E/L6E/L27E